MTTAVPAAPRSTRLILVEGLPGSGKTTLALWIHDWLRSRGIHAQWAREEAADHPAIDRPLRRSAPEPGLAERCVTGWQRYVARRLEEAPVAAPGRSEAARDRIDVLEGCLFQSTVRFLLEYRHEGDAPHRYLRGTESALAPLSPLLVHLAQSEPAVHLDGRLEARKGAAVVAKIAAYTESTPCARHHGWTGRAGLTSFYLHYDAVCRALAAETTMPTLRLDASRLNRAAVQERVAAWLSGQGVLAR